MAGRFAGEPRHVCGVTTLDLRGGELRDAMPFHVAAATTDVVFQLSASGIKYRTDENMNISMPWIAVVCLAHPLVSNVNAVGGIIANYDAFPRDDELDMN